MQCPRALCDAHKQRCDVHEQLCDAHEQLCDAHDVTSTSFHVMPTSIRVMLYKHHSRGPSAFFSHSALPPHIHTWQKVMTLETGVLLLSKIQILFKLK